jgi:3-deoxy-D-manno-octulosonic-acid transferase
MKTPSRWGRRVLRSSRLRRLSCWVIHLYIRFVYATNRWTVEGGEVPRRLHAEGHSFILAFWHGRLLMIPMAWQRLAPMHMLISAHRDGRIIADAVTYFGVHSIAGSSRRGGSAALRGMLKRLNAGECVGITPDGPRGPATQATSGIVNLARLAGVPIVPIVFATSRRRVLPSWDRFHLALPFGRGAFLWGEPIEIARDLDPAGLERARLLVEDRMNDLAQEADRRVGHEGDSPSPALTPTLTLPRLRGRVRVGAEERGPSSMSGWPLLYRSLTAAAAPFVTQYLRARCRRGKEDRERLDERFGIASAARPPAPLVWVHAASVGEASSVLALIERILAERPAIELLITTGTVAAARLLEGRLPPRARHQFVPVDVPRAVERFLDHWHPDLAIWVESELWPNLVLATHRRGTPMLLANARLSAGSLARWRALPGLVRPVLRAFALCLAQDEVQAERFRRLGARPVASVGDLKAAAAPLAADPAALAALRRQIGARPVWLAASTHPGEEEIAAAAHAQIARDHPGLLTIVAPRHPVRGPAIAKMLQAQALRTARRSAREAIVDDTDIYLADTLGELGLSFRLAGIAFVGGSLVRKGGHNPFEAARLDCAIVHGPDMTNCAAMARALDDSGAALTVSDAESLAGVVALLLADPAERARRAEAGAQVVAASGGALDAVLDRFAPWLDALAPVAVEEMPAAPLRAIRHVGADARP